MFENLALVLVFVTTSYAVNHSTNCYIEGKAKEYDGNIIQIRGGRKCLDWADCLDVKTGFTNKKILDTDFPDGSIIAASNYCRDPHSFGSLWCFVTCNAPDHITPWELGSCAINACRPACYFKGQSKEYRGYITQTQGGIECLNWKDFRGYKHTRDVNFPEKSVDKAANFCRDPDARGTPWCFSADNHVDNCTVPVCSIGPN